MRRPEGAIARERREKHKHGKWRRKPPKISYRERYMACKALGFEDYNQYLESKLWARIRKRVFALANGRCRCCGRAASQIHHSSYDLATMSGHNLHWLSAVCADCHRQVEFEPGGEKRSPKGVGKAYVTMRRSFYSERWFLQPWPSEPLDQLSEEFLEIVGKPLDSSAEEC